MIMLTYNKIQFITESFGRSLFIPEIITDLNLKLTVIRQRRPS